MSVPGGGGWSDGGKVTGSTPGGGGTFGPYTGWAMNGGMLGLGSLASSSFALLSKMNEKVFKTHSNYSHT